MELYDQYSSLEELLTLTQRRVLHPWQQTTTDPIDDVMSFHHLLSSGAATHFDDYSDTNYLGPTSLIFPNPCFDHDDIFSAALDQELSPIDGTCNNNPYAAATQFHVSGYEPLPAPATGDGSSYGGPFGSYGPVASVVDEEAEPYDGLFGDEFGTVEMVVGTATATSGGCKVEPVASPDRVPVLGGRKNRMKRVEGQPSKNLMAERRRRKRLNDRLSMLRSIVPKISKMDRTSILGDTIDYMKELLDKIQNLQHEIKSDSNQLDISQHIKPNDVLVRNSPKFNVERRNEDTKIDICCSGKPGLLLSTLNTLETLGLEIQQCVISCFSDFALQASCSKEMVVTPEDIKQALFRNAGYGGRCL